MKSYCSPCDSVWPVIFFSRLHLFGFHMLSTFESVVNRKVLQSIQIQCVYCELSKIHRSLQKLSIFIVIFMWKQKHLIWVWFIRYYNIHHSYISPPVDSMADERKSPKTLRNTIQIANEAMSTQIRSDRRFTLIETVVSFSPRAFCVWKIFVLANVPEYTKWKKEYTLAVW